MQYAAIILLCVGAAVGYGVVHDQITVRICLEYFTVAHPHIIDSNDPTALGFLWGVIATWWVGAILGYMLAAAARQGPWPKLSARSLIAPVLILMAASGLVAFLAGLIAWIYEPRIGLPSPWADLIPREHQRGFLTDAVAHLASYGMGFAGGIVIILRTLYLRYRQSRSQCAVT